MENIKLVSKTYEGWKFDGKFESAAEIYGSLKSLITETKVSPSNFKLSSNFQESFLEFTLSWKYAGRTESKNLMLITGDFLLKNGNSFEVVKKAMADRYFTVKSLDADVEEHPLESADVVESDSSAA